MKKYKKVLENEKPIVLTREKLGKLFHHLKKDIESARVIITKTARILSSD